MNTDGGITEQFKYTLIGLMILTGAANTIVYKLQNTYSQKVDDVGDTYNGYGKFNHPFMQAVTMFMGEALCIFLFLYIRKQDTYKREQIEAQAKNLRIKPNYYLLAIPAMCDLFSSTCSYIALNSISPSIYQMLRGGAIITVAICGKLFLKNFKLEPYKLIGCGFVLVGITLVGASSFIFPMNSDNTESASIGMQIFAIVLLILSVVGNGLQFVSEERLFEGYFLHPFEVVGVEGLWGLLAYIIITTALTFTPCPESYQKECLPYDGEFYFERADFYFKQAFASVTLFFYIILGIFTIATFNICGVSVTKYISSLARSLIDVTRTVVIWIVAITLTLTTETKKWENTRWQAISLELVGFILLVFGNLVYQGIIKITGDYKRVNADMSDSLIINQQSLQGKQD